MSLERVPLTDKTKQSTAPEASGILQRRCACGQHTSGSGQCDECKEEESVLQRRKSDRHTEPQAHLSPSSSHRNGRPLSASLAQRFKPCLGALIDRVRVHDDNHGADFAHGQSAAALTAGTDIYFARGAYQTGTAAGVNLIAHELAHVHQQHRPNGPPPGYRSTPGDIYEREADRFADTGRLAIEHAIETMPGSPTIQKRSAAEQIATAIRNAVEGLGTDEEAIFNALTGRTAAEIAAIEAAYVVLSNGETLEARLRDELSGDDLSQALSLLRGETAATETARRLYNAMRGLGTDEEAIYAAVAGRSADQWNEIQTAYQQMTNRSLLTDLQDELTDSEWRYVQTMLPGAAGGAATAQDRATVIANQLEAAMAGLGTDEEAIYTALTGRSDAELREIEARFRLLTGFPLNTRLREELSDADYARAQRLLHPVADPIRIAERLREAVQGPGTDELEIQAILTGRDPAELILIRAAYQGAYGESLRDRLTAELSDAEQTATLNLEQQGLMRPEDEIALAVEGAGTDEERLSAVLTEISTDPNPGPRLQAVIDAYEAADYGDLLQEVREDLSSSEHQDALALMFGHVPTGTCNADQINEGRDALSGAVSMSQNAVAKLNQSIGAGRLASDVENALAENFNPGNAPGAVNIALATQVRDVLRDTRVDLLTGARITCGTPVPFPAPCIGPDPCVPNPDCSNYTYGWTCGAAGPGAVVRLCPAFFICKNNKSTGLLHEFVHHIGGVSDKFYRHQAGYQGLTPIGDSSANDSLDNADSFSEFAEALL